MAYVVLKHDAARLAVNDWIGREIVVALDRHGGAIGTTLFEATGVLEHVVRGEVEEERVPDLGYEVATRRASELAGLYRVGDSASLDLAALPHGTWALLDREDERLIFVLEQGEVGELMPGPGGATYEVTLTLSLIATVPEPPAAA